MSEQVKRYHALKQWSYEHAEGKYVLFIDYDLLRAERDAMREALNFVSGSYGDATKRAQHDDAAKGAQWWESELGMVADEVGLAVERLHRQLQSSDDLGERMKVALRRIGTSDSYVKWAAECRSAYDELATAKAEVERLRGALTTCAEVYEREQYNSRIDILHAAYDARCIARKALEVQP